MFKTRPLSKIKSTILVPPDKSISHRAVFFSGITKGKTIINNFLDSRDTVFTLKCFRALKVNAVYRRKRNELTISSGGKYFNVDSASLFTGESGTTFRIISGILAGQKFKTRLSCAPSLRKRPMKRITLPLRLMGADIEARGGKGEEYPPLLINPVKRLSAITYDMPVASAQVKSALLFASQYARGVTRVKEPGVCRDHTERMMNLFGLEIDRRAGYVTCRNQEPRSPGEIFVPGDISSAAFFMVLGLILKRAEIILPGVGINPTRTGLIKVLRRMGADIRISRRQSYFEPYGDIVVKSSELLGTVVRPAEVPLMIDEIPILMVVACFARGVTEIYGLGELKVKETDRISSMVYNLKRAGMDITAESYNKGRDFMVRVKGGKTPRASRIRSFNDHRTAMSMIVFALASGKSFSIDDCKCVSKSFPGFINIIRGLY